MVIISRLLDSGSSEVVVALANLRNKTKTQIRAKERSSSEVIYTLSLKKLLNL